MSAGVDRGCVKRHSLILMCPVRDRRHFPDADSNVQPR
jgi:hypothetical protein